MRRSILSLMLAPMLLSAAPAPPVMPTPNDIVAQAPSGAWRAVDPDNLLVIDLAGGKHVAIELAPGFAPAHVANIRALVRGHWFDGNAVTRVQDDYVVQWGGADEKKPLPPGVAAHLPAEYERPLAGLAMRPLPYPDTYAPRVGHVDGWPVASDGSNVWLTHCYGMVGVGRDIAHVVHAGPRHYDRKIGPVNQHIGEPVDFRPVNSGIRKFIQIRPVDTSVGKFVDVSPINTCIR